MIPSNEEIQWTDHKPIIFSNFILNETQNIMIYPSPTASPDQFSLTDLCDIKTENRSFLLPPSPPSSTIGTFSPKSDANSDAIIFKQNIDSFIEEANIEPIISKAMEETKLDILQTCNFLQIPPNPYEWSTANVQSWINYILSEFNIPCMIDLPLIFPEDGKQLCKLVDINFIERFPLMGEIICAKLELCKLIISENITSMKQVNGKMKDPLLKKNGSHIHLWQFLKELLTTPEEYGNYIRWLDKKKGVFKIEDSMKVAKLWGNRKNRPAMNYDKLSRSIRQYYKKGIMKKTERSQRLVYQFCHPFNL